MTTKAFLGLTVSCARCHDHKFDPIPTADYYSLYGVFANTAEPAREAVAAPRCRRPPSSWTISRGCRPPGRPKAAVEAELVALREVGPPAGGAGPEAARDPEAGSPRRTREIGDLEASHAAPPKANVLVDVASPRDYPVLLRGEAQNKGPVVARHFLSILSPDPKHPIAFRNGQRPARARPGDREPLGPADRPRPRQPGLAAALRDGLRPDAGRPGKPVGAADQPGAPGLPGRRASSRRAGRSRSSSGSSCSAASTRSRAPGNPRYADTDPDNRLQWRCNVRQLDFEQMHDSILAIAGTIDLTMGGRPVPIGSEGFATRRAVYAFIDRGTRRRSSPSSTSRTRACRRASASSRRCRSSSSS